MKKLYLIDISSFIFRSYYAIRPLHTREGVPVNAVFGVVSMINKLIETHKPDHMIVCYDRPEKGFRHELYPAYKANRSAPPEDLVPQFEIINEFIRTYPIKSLAKPGFEADDLIATLVARYKTIPDMQIYIVTSDKDLMQLVDDNVFIYDTMKEKIITRKEVVEKFGVPPEKVIDVQSLSGDPTDNIPGIVGVGPKTATKLVLEYGSLEAVLDHASEIKGKLGEKIAQGRANALLSRQLVTLPTQVETQADWDDLVQPPADVSALNTFYQKLDFTKFISRQWQETPSVPQTQKAVFVGITSLDELKALVDNILQTKPQCLAFDTETDSLDAHNATLVGLSLCYQQDKAYYLPLAHREGPNLPFADVVRMISPLLVSNDLAKAGQNSKFDLNVLAQYHLSVNPIAHDTLIASYLLDPEGQHNLDYLAKKYLGVETIKFANIVGKDKTFADVALETATQYAAEDAWVAHELVDMMLKELVANGLDAVYRDIEMPLVPVLAKMEQCGVLIDEELLTQLHDEFSQRLNSLESEIYELAGEHININSPKQLAVILFEKMGLPVIKKTKTGFSTDVAVLTVLAREHALPKKLLDYRSITKLLSTYVIGLKNIINPRTSRVHTSFNQAIVATGRLSSTEPNLQNIPIKTEEGRRIRQLFIAPEDHWLLSADYSQIELRLLAAFSDDPHLKDAYHKNQDIHARTAAHIFGVPIERVDQHQRSIGKTINFGVVYGQSPFGLAQQLGIPQKEARRFIDSFYNEFSRVRDYREQVLARGRERGYVSTFLGRRRYLPDINSKNFMARQNAERMAFNAVFQGSAADLIKKAMIVIHHWIIKDQLKTKMLLQVHDELLFEVPQEELTVIRKFIPEMMERAFSLSVPLKVSCHVGKNWAEAH